MKQKLLKFCLWTGKLKRSLMIMKLLLVLLSVFAFQVNGSAIAKTTIKSSFAQKVTGQVTDSGNGEPIIGASISIEGTTKGVVTDVDGKFSLDVPENAVLLITYVGYLTERVTVGTQAVIEVKLVQDITKLEEIVVVGFGTQKKVNLTGAVATVDSKALASRPTTNVGQALQGMVAGLNVTQSNNLGGSLEARPNLNVRGTTTIGNGSSGSPLVLIDGMEGDINAVNPNDVENISILKDAAASSIYGSRAPFGVILVTTKKGSAGKLQVNYTGSYVVSTPIKLPEMMDSYTFANFFNDGAINMGKSARFNPDHLQRIQDFIAGKITTSITQKANGTTWADGYDFGNDNVQWFKQLYKSSTPSTEHALSFTGGTDKFNFFLSSDYLHKDGLLKFNPDSYDRYTINSKIGGKLADWFTFNYTFRFSREDYTRPTVVNDSYYSNIARQMWPTLPLYDPNGELFSSPSPALALRDGGKDKTQTDWSYHQVNLLIEPIKGWKTNINLNYKIGDVFRHWDVLPTYNHDVNDQPYYYFQNYYFTATIDANPNVHEEANRTNYFTPNVYTEYSKSIGKNNMKIMAGFQSESNKYRNLGVTRVGVMVVDHPIIDVTSGTDASGKVVAPVIFGKYEEWSTEGVFGRLNYDYDGKYLIEGNLRYDGTSRYRSDKSWNYFPSASAGWNMSREDFWKPLEKVVNNFKVRGSYGQLGNQNTSSLYPTYATMNFEAGTGNWLLGDQLQNKSWAPGLVSASLGWEKINTWDLGIDVGMLNNRLTLTADYYVRNTKDMVGPAPELPSTLGTGVPSTNNCDLQTKGFEISIAWQDRLKNGLGYSAHFTLADAQSVIKRFSNPTGTLGDPKETDPTKIQYHAGETMGEIWGFQTLGMAKDSIEMVNHLATLATHGTGGQTALGANWGAGDIMYADLNGDGKIDNGANTLTNHGDLKKIGSSAPRFVFGLDLSADWKGFDVRTFFQGIMKKDFFQSSAMFFGIGPDGSWGQEGFVEHKDYYRPLNTTNPLGPNINSYYARPLDGNDQNCRFQTRYLQNAAYLRLKNLQVGYTIPSSLTRKIFIEKCRIYISGENLLTVTKLSKIYDPETIDGKNGGNVYPLSKVYSAGLTVNF